MVVEIGVMQFGCSFVEVVSMVEALLVIVFAPLGLHESTTSSCKVQLLQLYPSIALACPHFLHILATSRLGFPQRKRAHTSKLVIINLLILVCIVDKK